MALTNEDLQAIAQLMDRKMEPLSGDIQSIKLEVTDFKLTLENETNRNIRRVAECHLDLSRKLDDAMKIENEKEMLVIRVNILENELRQVKDKLATICES